MSPTGTTLEPLRGSFLMPAFENARVYDAMRVGVFTCPKETSLKEVARMMATHHIHCVIVTELKGESGQPWGVISDLDLVRAGEGALERTAGEAAATELVTVAADETVERAAQLMGEHDISHLVVVQPQTGKPAGVLSTLDIAGVLAWGEA
ncbi:MAG TPA: CBS domain-containing protein [Thermoleophilaceae bacterium]|jgi:CBS domain-containing protein